MLLSMTVKRKIFMISKVKNRVHEEMVVFICMYVCTYIGNECFVLEIKAPKLRVRQSNDSRILLEQHRIEFNRVTGILETKQPTRED